MPSVQRPSIGFVLVTFNLPEQTIFLCRRLSEMFGAPPIALHHDYGQSNLEEKELPSNVRVVSPWIATAWGTVSVVEANLAALRLLYQTGDPDWVVSLSTADYPIKSPDRILDDLAATPFDAFLDHREIYNRPHDPGHVRDETKAFADPAWLTLGYKRYVALNVNPERLTWRFPSLHRDRIVRGRLVERFFSPFDETFRPFGGDAWYTINRRAAKVLAEDNELLQRMRKHYRKRRVPEESFYHTILCNHPELRIAGNNLRYTDWKRGGTSPRYLDAHDIPALLASDAHFARKFPFDPGLFDAIDMAAMEVSV